MIKSLLTIALTLGCFSLVHAQETAPKLFSAANAKASATADPGAMRMLRSDPSIVSINPINLDSSLLAKGTPALTLNMSDRIEWRSEMKKTYALDDQSVVWSGTIDLPGASKTADGEIDSSSALFVVTGNRVFGQMIVEGQAFEIMTSNKGGQYYLIKRDFSKLPAGDDTPQKIGIDPSQIEKIQAAQPDKAVSTIRVLQIATPQAVNALGGQAAAGDRMRFFIAQANQVYANNGLQITMQNAGLRFSTANQPTNDGPTLVDRLSNTGDGYLDGLASTTRNNTSADLVGLIVGPGLTSSFGGLCGIADAIAANASTAFFVVEQSCTNFTFVHEMGHLFGARHDNDPTTTPFAYGHGFVNSGSNFRTVMAVSSNPQPRIGYFSTDDQTFNGGSLGNASFYDNERVHDVRRGTMAGFR